MAKNSYYTVWTGRQIGVFNSWDECRLQVEGFPGAKYKGFPTREAAESAFKSEPDFGKSETEPIKSWQSLPEGTPKPNTNSIAVDAACSGNPGKMEYRGVFVDTGTELFKSPVFEGGTNNIGEFLAIVHCLAWQQKNNEFDNNPEYVELTARKEGRVKPGETVFDFGDPGSPD